MNVRRFRSAVPLWLALAVGCAATRVAPPPDTDQLAVGPAAAAIHADLTDTLARLIDSSPSPAIDNHSSAATARNVLVLSGGGKYGAFSAGVLAGWSAAGTRPSFDVVTGISTGALLAPLAFLGPRYDRFLEDAYTTLHTAQIYRWRAWLAVPWSVSLADAKPLRHLINKQVSDGFLAEIAQAHAAGRRLYVGTTNLDTGRLIVWDLGALAAGTDPNKRQLFRQVLLASCSIPGLLPPVPIEIEVDGRRYTELHVDGGVSASMFLPAYMVLGGRGGAGANVHVIVAGKLSPEPQCVEGRFIAVSSKALQELLNAKTQGDLLRVFLLTRLTGGRFAVTSAPQDVPVNPDATRFNPEEMRRLFDAGCVRAAIGTAWRSTPPGVSPEEWSWPRTGTQFNTPSKQPVTTERVDSAR